MFATPDDEFLKNISFPLPYRVLFLIGLGILGWATNLHGLDLCGVDVVATMNLRVDTGLAKPTTTVYQSSVFNHSKAVLLYQSTYQIFVSYSAFCLASWALFKLLTLGNPSLVEKYGYIPVITAVAIIFLLLCPFDVLVKSEREKFTSAIRRCLFPGPVSFSDVILADIGTSFAKVFGDVWQSIWMLKSGNSVLALPVQDNWLRWILPAMMSIPFFLRFRQCMVEYNLPGNDSRKPLYNALKYATSFPVIFLSAAQRLIVADGGRSHAEPGGRWHGDHPLFRLWLFAAVVNSLYSFWWDVSNDWGLDLLRFQRPQNHDRYPHHLHRLNSGTPLLDHNSDLDSLISSPVEGHHVAQTKDLSRRHYRQSCRGLRPVLFYPRAIYPILIFLNLLLRMTWSVKLSTHVQNPRDGSFAFFWLEVAEVIRRWLWVFIRVEWEVIRTEEECVFTSSLEDHSADEGDYEMVSPLDSEFRMTMTG